MTTWLFVGDSITVGLAGSSTKTGFRGPFAATVEPAISFVGPFVDSRGLHHGGIGGSSTKTFLYSTGFARFVKAPAGEPTWMETYKPDIVHLMLGTNDIISDRKESVAVLADRVVQLLELAKKQSPKTRFLVGSIVEAGPDWFSAQAAAYNAVLPHAVAKLATFVDTSKEINKVFRAEGYKKVTSDGTHPNDLGYNLMAKGLLAAVRDGGKSAGASAGFKVGLVALVSWFGWKALRS